MAEHRGGARRRRAAIGVIAAAALAAGVARPASAQEAAGAAPGGALSPIVWGGKMTVTLQSDQTLNKVGGVKPYNNTYSEPELEWFVNFGQRVSINGLAKMEQVRQVQDNSLFRYQGAWIDQLYATFSLEPFRLYGGKIHPRFGRAWDAAPGLYGTDFAEDYELTEKIGLGVAADVDWFGKHTLSFEAYRADTTFLSNSILTRPRVTDSGVIRPGRLRRADGGMANTDSLDNYAAVLTGSDIPALDGLAYNVGWASQRGTTSGSTRTERSWVAGLQWEFPLNAGWTAKPMLEWARVENQGGNDRRTDYVTAGFEVDLGQGWTAQAFGTARPIRDGAAGDRYTDHLAGVSVGYDLGKLLFDGLGVSVGYKHERIQRENQNTVGIAFTYERKF